MKSNSDFFVSDLVLLLSIYEVEEVLDAQLFVLLYFVGIQYFCILFLFFSDKMCPFSVVKCYLVFYLDLARETKGKYEEIILERKNKLIYDRH